MTFIIPEELTPVKAINFANFVCQYLILPEQHEYSYDFARMQHCKPFGLLITASAIRNNQKAHPNSKHTFINVQDNQGTQFASSFGFFQSIGYNLGRLTTAEDFGNRYIPIKKITAEALHSEYTDTTLLNAKVDRHADILANTLVGDISQSAHDALQYCFREMIRNSFEHANVDELWVCGQYWPTRHEAEIAILDEGIGILGSFRNNRRIHATTCSEANKLSLQPGLSRTLGLRQDPFDYWQNSGYGLYVASTLCAMNDGYFCLSSGDNAILVNGETQTEYKSIQTGTAVCLNLRVDSQKLANFDTTLKMIVQEGEKRAKENSEARIVTASKVTSIASMIHHIQDNIPALTHSETKRVHKTGDIVDSIIGSNVLYSPEKEISKGRLFGSFTVGKIEYKGLMDNIPAKNRRLYIRNNIPIHATVKSVLHNIYILSIAKK